MKLKPFTAGDWTGTENAWQHADDADPACLTFSLKGITAALKMVCPKR
jgi:hypothetical protein